MKYIEIAFALTLVSFPYIAPLMLGMYVFLREKKQRLARSAGLTLLIYFAFLILSVLEMLYKKAVFDWGIACANPDIFPNVNCWRHTVSFINWSSQWGVLFVNWVLVIVCSIFVYKRYNKSLNQIDAKDAPPG